jgi:hypothetical protein
MTQIYKQRGLYDCFLACLAMAVQRPPETIFPAEIYAQIESDQGCARHDSTETKALFALAGLAKDAGYWSCYIGGVTSKLNVLDLLEGRRAIVQVNSLNNAPPAQHYVYWDGRQLHDPSNKQIYQWLRQLTSAQHVFILNERTEPKAEPISEERLRKMVDRFIGWKIPQSFGPDGYITFDREKAKASVYWPTGTNLLSCTEAEEMLRYMLEQPKENPHG